MADHIADSIELKSNNLAQIQSRISAAERQVEGIEEQMEKLRSAYDAQISELRRQRDAKALEIASHKNLLSPVHQLPIEVLSKIFELSCSPDADIAPEHDIIRRTFVLSKICVHWRKVAHDTPRIWSRVCLSMSQHLRAITGDVVWVGEWLSRSRGLPIELHLNFLNPYSRRQDITRGMYKLLQFALTHRHRIQILNLSGDMSCFLPIFRLPPSSLPLLKKLSLHSAFQDPYPIPYDIDIQAFLGSLELSQVELSKSGPITGFFESLILPTTQLVALQVKDTSPSFPKLPVYVDLFQQCPNLVNLIIDLQMSSGFDPTISISLPSLKFLDIVCRQLSQGVSLLHCLVVPSLQDLSLHWCGLSFPEFIRDIDRLRNHSESASRLTSLTVYIRWLYTNDDLTLLLALFPRVTSVRIYRIEFDVSAFLRAMTYSRGDPVLLPKILDLELGFKTLTDRQSYYPSELVPMILSRSWPARSHPDTEITSRQVMDLEDDVTNEVCRLQKFNLYGSWLKEPDEELIAGIPGLTFEYHPNGCK